MNEEGMAVSVKNECIEAVVSMKINKNLQKLSNLPLFASPSIWRLFQLFMLWVAATSAFAADPNSAIHSQPSIEQHADGLLVKFKPHVNQQQVIQIAEKYSAREIISLSAPGQVIEGSQMAQWRHLKFDPGVDLQQIMQRMLQDVEIETVELNQLVTIQKQ